MTKLSIFIFLLAFLCSSVLLATDSSCNDIMKNVFINKWNKEVSARIELSLLNTKKWATTAENGFTQIDREQEMIHLENNFRLLVRTIRTNQGEGDPSYFFRQLGNMRASFLADPARREERIYSTSIVDDQHMATFGSIGFVLDISGDNVVATSASDMMTWKLQKNWGFNDPTQRQDEFAAALLENIGVETPDNLLKTINQSTTPWTEVILYDSPAVAKRPKIIGLYFSGYQGMNMEFMEKYKAYAKEIGLPFVLVMRK